MKKVLITSALLSLTSRLEDFRYNSLMGAAGTVGTAQVTGVVRVAGIGAPYILGVATMVLLVRSPCGSREPILWS